MSLAKRWRGFPIGACLATAEAAEGMAPGSHGSTFAAIRWRGAGQCGADVMLKPASSSTPRNVNGCSSKTRSVVDRHPGVLAEVAARAC